MAKVIHPDESKNGGGDGKFHLVGTASGVAFDFELKRNRVKVSPKSPDWQAALTEDEKLKIFRQILKDYRIRSMGDDGMKLAAIGITEDGDISIATNTERLSSPYFRQCAELNMVTSLTQNEVYKQLRKGATEPQEPKLKALYLLGGQDGEGIKRPLCQCGNCTDMLSHVMEPNAPVYLLPLKAAPDATIDTAAPTIMHVEAGHVWKTTIETLNAHREINLSGAAANAQRSGFRQLLKQTKLPEEQARELNAKLTGAANDHGASIHSVTDLVSYLLQPQHLIELPKDLAVEAQHALSAMLKSAENALTQRHSVAALDAGVENGELHLATLNRFMVGQIQGCFADRLRALQARDGLAHASNSEVEALITEKVGAIRCVVLQLDDGTFRYALESRSKLDNATPSAEMSALAGAANKLGTQGVREVWAMEMAPKDIQKGLMHTSSKEGTERLLKRRTTTGKDVKFHFIPFNAGTQTDDRKIAALTTDVQARELFPSFFLGSKQAGAMR